MSGAFERILIPVDFTSRDDDALQTALQLAREGKTRVTLLHVVEEIEGATETEVGDLYETLRANAEARIEILAQRFREAAIEVSVKIALGKPGHEIVQTTMEEDSDLVVLRSHVVDPRDPRASWSTLSYQVSIVCPCPVLLVK